MSTEVREKFEKAWGVQLPKRRGITKITALDQMVRGEVKAVFIMGENTVVSDISHGGPTDTCS